MLGWMPLSRVSVSNSKPKCDNDRYKHDDFNYNIDDHDYYDNSGNDAKSSSYFVLRAKFK